jgi:hypothetical protein
MKTNAVGVLPLFSAGRCQRRVASSFPTLFQLATAIIMVTSCYNPSFKQNRNVAAMLRPHHPKLPKSSICFSAPFD